MTSRHKLFAVYCVYSSIFKFAFITIYVENSEYNKLIKSKQFIIPIFAIIR
jgi:hypothetical protein